jgi:hypothetical protein
MRTASRSWLRPFLRPLWSPFREIAVLSLVINLLALAVPVFVMRVYDQVVFHAGLETLEGFGTAPIRCPTCSKGSATAPSSPAQQPSSKAAHLSGSPLTASTRHTCSSGGRRRRWKRAALLEGCAAPRLVSKPDVVRMGQ